jgi:hypothetical protein
MPSSLPPAAWDRFTGQAARPITRAIGFSLQRMSGTVDRRTILPMSGSSEKAYFYAGLYAANVAMSIQPRCRCVVRTERLCVVGSSCMRNF